MEKEEKEEIIEKFRKNAIKKTKKCKNCGANTKEVSESFVRCTWKLCRKKRVFEIEQYLEEHMLKKQLLYV